MDLNKPIDITAVNEFLRKYQKELKALDMMDAAEFLQHLTPYPGITDSVELSRVEGGTISKRYSGIFIGSDNLGKVVPRRLIVRPVVSEMDDEPERYRRAYITEVPGSLRKQHPFEGWIIQHGINLASQDLYYAAMNAKYDASSADTDILTAFDGLGTIIQKEIDKGAVSTTVGNMFPTGKITRANAGDVLLEMYRSMPLTFRRKRNIKMFLSGTVMDLYQDWLKDESIVMIGDDPKTNRILRGTDGNCELVPMGNLPVGSQFVMLTTKENVIYGFDKSSDFRSMTPFPSGNPYHFTATMKYVIGFQLISIHRSEFCINDQPLSPEEEGGEEETQGSIKVTLTPQEAVTAGAKWRVKGTETWAASGETVGDQPAGSVTIEFSPAEGYDTPAEQEVTVAAGQISEENVEYIKTT